jgi:hypothetical protein
MPTFTVTTDINDETHEVDAEYFNADDGFVTFKDVDHKQVATFSAHRVVSVVRLAKKTEIGTATVRIVPTVDSEAMTALIEEISMRVRHAALDGIRA